jgi:hypothetical protein
MIPTRVLRYKILILLTCLDIGLQFLMLRQREGYLLDTDTRSAYSKQNSMRGIRRECLYFSIPITTCTQGKNPNH